MEMKAYACPRCLTLSCTTEDGDGGVHTCTATPLVRDLEARIEELENLLTSVTPEKDAEGIILNAKQKLGGEPGDSLIHLCIKTKYERDRSRAALEKIADCAIIPPFMTEQARQLMNWQDDARKALNP